jgi:uncharacterized protein YdeI (YjbR/CyaY-like superfamily)
VTTRGDWRAWLAKHHATEAEVWLVFNKRHTGKPRVPYNDAVEEALCFGWIDSIVKRVDDETYAQKFTPRKPNSKWSALNRKRVAALIGQGRMMEAGMATLSGKHFHAQAGDSTPKRSGAIPPFISHAIKAKPKAWLYFTQLAPSYRRNYIGWIMAAKKDETRQKRLREAIALLLQNKKLGLK